MIQKILIVAGVLALVLGVLWPWLSKIGLGRLPGDVTWTIGGSRVYIPFTTSLILSIAATLVLRMFGR
jgi:hypothetical protein